MCRIEPAKQHPHKMDKFQEDRETITSQHQDSQPSSLAKVVFAPADTQQCSTSQCCTDVNKAHKQERNIWRHQLAWCVGYPASHDRDHSLTSNP